MRSGTIDNAAPARATSLIQRRPLRSIFAARTGATSLAVTAFRATWAPGTASARWSVLVRGDSAVTVVIEFLQRCDGFGDFVGANRAVPVQVECFDNGHGRRFPPHAAWPARAFWATWTTWTTFAGGRTLSVGALVPVLRREQARRCAQCQREEDDFCFHSVLWLWLFSGARRLHRLNAVNCPVGAQK